MATDTLIVKLDADVKGLNKKLNETEDGFDDLGESAKKSQNKLSDYSAVAKKAGGVVAVTATAVTALAGALTAMTLSSASSRRELDLFSSQAKTSAADFQALSFATTQFGINAEQISDISKDISDRLGEFSTAGTGTFQDYADVMKLTKDEAMLVAKEFQHLSSEEVIGKMVSNMESAGTTGAQMTFVLESMGNDLSRLTPLFSDNSKALNELKDRFRAVNDELQITDVQAESLKEVAGTYGLLTSQLGNSATAISATLAPVMNDFFNSVIDVVPDATQVLVDFFNTFISTENITQTKELEKRMEASAKEITNLGNALAIAQEQESSGLLVGRGRSTEEVAEKTRLLNEQLVEEAENHAEIATQLQKVNDEQARLDDAKRIDGGEITGEGGKDGASGVGTGDQIQAIADRFKTEEELLTEKLERELFLIGDNNLLKEDLYLEYLSNLAMMDDEAERKRREAKDKAKSKEEKATSKQEKKDEKQRKSDKKSKDDEATKDEIRMSNAMSLAALVFEDNKAISAGIAFINTAQGVTKALAIQDYAGAALTAAIGAAQIQNILSSSKGGNSSSGSVGGSSQASPRDPDFEQDTTSLEVTESNVGGSSTQRIELFTDGSDDIISAIAQALNEGQRKGQF